MISLNLCKEFFFENQSTPDKEPNSLMCEMPVSIIITLELQTIENGLFYVLLCMVF